MLNSIQSGFEQNLSSLLERFPDVFPTELPSGLPPRRSSDFEIKLETDAKVVSRPCYRMSEKENSELKNQVDNLLQKGSVRSSKSPWASPFLLVGKKDGNM